MGNTPSTPLFPPTRMSQKGIEFLKHQEGFKGEFSQDGKSAESGQSIGFGINCNANPKVCAQIKEELQKTGKPLTKEQGEVYLRQILPQYEKAVRNLENSDKLSQNGFDALVSLAYHKGGKGMSRTVKDRMKIQDMEGVYQAIKNDQTSSKAGETYSKRRLDEAELFKSSDN
ncbi:uncharacterized protein Z519_07781 [Cladophialophora bantiana CBS 173.52]|uniref:Lysozyme n=1 Tax=Cladophialophora bantiana (strain ATCC 10958 / CBS 173.52 / CDC B-1940 / NIH 8579) TaxID=1442370 RepID=A0A0D2EPA3_CLAB1|nr:uncharacterized protein Z519_07781 [Cladophialophora bantiana CBS 173.52]KIW91811.1 hypothetical protein Z519_07781 [Cladophialophora bantiana CBS 173.52]